jgi:hypothetical protein
LPNNAIPVLPVFIVKIKVEQAGQIAYGWLIGWQIRVVFVLDRIWQVVAATVR